MTGSTGGAGPGPAGAAAAGAPLLPLLLFGCLADTAPSVDLALSVASEMLLSDNCLRGSKGSPGGNSLKATLDLLLSSAELSKVAEP